MGQLNCQQNYNVKFPLETRDYFRRPNETENIIIS